MMILKTIEGDTDFNQVDIEKDDEGYVFLIQDEDRVILNKAMVQELGLFLTNVDLD